MLGDLIGGARLAARRWPGLLALAAMIVVACVVLVLVLSDVLSQTSVLRGGVELRHRRAVSFFPNFQNQGVSHVDDSAVRSLAAKVPTGDAYTAVVGNVATQDPTFADGVPTVLIFGAAASDIFPGLRLCSPAPCAMRGVDVHDPRIGPLKIADRTIPVTSVLPKNATFFDVNAAGLQLDSHIVIRLPARDLLHVDAYEREEALTKAVFLGQPSRVVDTYVSTLSHQGLALVPQNLATDQPRRFRDLMIRSAMYLVGLIAFMALVISAFAVAAASTLQGQMRSFTIRRMCGASGVNISLRVGAYLATVTLLLPVPVLWATTLVGYPFADAAHWVLGGIVGTFAVLWALSVVRVALPSSRGRRLA